MSKRTILLRIYLRLRPNKISTRQIEMAKKSTKEVIRYMNRAETWQAGKL